MHDFHAIDIPGGKLVTPYCHKVNFSRVVLTDVDLISFSAKLKVHNIFKHSGNRLRI